VVQLKILVNTKTTVDGETSVDFSSKLEMPQDAEFDVYLDNGGLVISALNEVSDGQGTKRDISVQIVLDHELSKKIAAACKDLPRLPK
jgi:hypothetical protein